MDLAGGELWALGTLARAIGETAHVPQALKRRLVHIPDKDQVMTRYCGWYANHLRGKRRQLATEGPGDGVRIAS